MLSEMITIKFFSALAVFPFNFLIGSSADLQISVLQISFNHYTSYNIQYTSIIIQYTSCCIHSFRALPTNYPPIINTRYPPDLTVVTI